MPFVDQKGSDRLANYVEVKDRIRLFYEAYPDGKLCTDRVEIWQDDGVPRIVVKALAYRAIEDPHPAVGWSWMVLPGSTPYTKGSELENTETSAWGRAIGALGIGIDKSIASGDEVRGKAGEGAREPERDTDRDGFLGTVQKGTNIVDMQLRTETSPGPTWGFKLTAGRKGFQAVAVGPLAEALAAAGIEVGTTVTVWGPVDMIPWAKGGRDMPPFPRITIQRIATPDFVLPADEQPEVPPIVPGQEALDLA